MNFSNVLDLRNLQEQVKKAFCYQKLFWSFTVWINCSSDLKVFANSWLSASDFKNFSRSLEQFFLTEGQNNFGNKIPCFKLAILFSTSKNQNRAVMEAHRVRKGKNKWQSVKMKWGVWQTSINLLLLFPQDKGFRIFI